MGGPLALLFRVELPRPRRVIGGTVILGSTDSHCFDLVRFRAPSHDSEKCGTPSSQKLGRNRDLARSDRPSRRVAAVVDSWARATPEPTLP